MSRARETWLWGAAASAGGLLAWVLLVQCWPAPQVRTEAPLDPAPVGSAPGSPGEGRSPAAGSPAQEAPVAAPGVSKRPKGPPDPKAPGDWHAIADGPRWEALAEALDEADHPMAGPAAELALDVADSHRALGADDWAELLAREAQLLGYLGSTPLDPGLAEQVGTLEGAVKNLQQRPGAAALAGEAPSGE